MRLAGPSRRRSRRLRLQMKLQLRQQVPNIAIDICHFPGGFDHALQSGIIERLARSELQMLPAFDNSHGLGMRDLAGFVGDIQAMIEFIAQRCGSVEPIDQFGQRLVELRVLEPDFRQPQNEIKPGTGGIERSENNRSRRPIGVQQDHENVDKQALIVRPVDNQVADQRQNERSAIGGRRRGRGQPLEIRSGWKLT
jgi:hypothetical protein